MSQILHTSDNISVTGDLKEVNKTSYLYLVFSFQINGKMKTSSMYFELEKQENSTEISLKNYDEWYKVYELLGDVGYGIDLLDTPSGGNTINKWIQSCKQEKLETDTFYR